MNTLTARTMNASLLRRKSKPAAAFKTSFWSSLLEIRKPLSPGAKLCLGILAWVTFVAAWHLVSVSELAPARLFPGPLQVAQALYGLFAEQGFHMDVWASVKRIVTSFSIAMAIALPLGLLMGSFNSVYAIFSPLTSAFRYLPAPSFIPLLLMWLGTGNEQKIALLILGVVFFLITMIADNTKQVRDDFIDTARTLGASSRVIVWRVIFRAALPDYLITARQMLAVSWTYLVIAEIVASTDGIGAMMMRAKRFVHVDEIMAGILLIGVLGLTFDALFKTIHRYSFSYLYRS